jgi:hypothetical protein
MESRRLSERRPNCRSLAPEERHGYSHRPKRRKAPAGRHIHFMSLLWSFAFRDYVTINISPPLGLKTRAWQP